jgi:fibronectin-binding autotransporter adhesin
MRCVEGGLFDVSPNYTQPRIRGQYLFTGLLCAAMSGVASANCVTSGSTVTCDTSSTYTQRLGSGPSNASPTTVTINPGAQVAVGNSNAISLNNNAVITIGDGASVTNNATSNNGLWGGGPNTIEFGSNGLLTIGIGATVAANGTQNNGEPINVFGTNNTIINHGTISSHRGAAIWFEDKTTAAGTTNTVDNYGIIHTDLGASSNVIGNNGSGPVTFINRTGARVEGSLSFAGGNDNLTLEAGSVITGSFNGGGGTNSLTLGGAAGSSDSLAGDIRNFQTLTKSGLGIWTLTGAIGANGGGQPLQVLVDQGTLALTGNNANFNGSVTVNAAGTLEARAQSLPPSVLDNGLVRFVQDTAGTYSGLISGSGVVEKTLGGDLTLTGANTYSGGTTVLGGTVFISSDASLGAISGALTLNGGSVGTTATVTTSRVTTVGPLGGGINTAAGTTLTLNGVVDGTGTLTKAGDGTLVLANTNNSYQGTVIDGGVLQVSSNANLGLQSEALAFSGGTLQTTANMNMSRLITIDGDGGTINTDAGTTLNLLGAVTGAGTLTKTGAGVLDLSSASNVSAQEGGTAINGGVVRISSDANLGAPGAAVSFDGGTLQAANGLTIARNGTLNAGGGTIEVNGDAYTSTDYTVFNGVISGSGGLTKTGSGALVLNGNNSYTGQTNVTSGSLFVNGDQSAATGAINVSGASSRLYGSGIIGGDVNLSNGATFGPASAPNTPATLTINGNLNTSSDTVLLYNVVNTTVGGALNDLTVVNGNLTLDGRIDVIDQGQNLGPGVYRIINYSGTLTDNGLEIGSYVDARDTPTGRSLDNLSVQTVVPGQINLINTTGLSLTYWDGDVGPKNSGTIDGGNGTWRTAGSASTGNWTDPLGAVNAPWSDGQFAIFIGAPGTVTVNNGQGAVTASGMQFGVDGYQIIGDPLTLVDDGSNPGIPTSTIRVGDGTSDGAGMRATIGAVLGGSSTLRKTDAGTLVLTGANTYTGDTIVEGGTLEISSEANLGAGSRLLLNGGTLRAAADMSISRPMLLSLGGGIVETAAADGTATTLTYNGRIGGVGGSLTKTGAGTLVLASALANTYSGGTTISAGTLVGSAISFGNGGEILDNAALVIDQPTNATFFNHPISGSGSVTKQGAGVLTMTDDHTYTGGTTISAGTLQLGNGGTSGSLVGNVVDNASLDFNRSDSITFSDVISGTGAVSKSGSGIVTLTGNNTYTGTTTISNGWLYLDGDQSAATGATSVASGARLGGNGIVGGDVVMAGGSSLAPGAVPNTPATLTVNGNFTFGDTTQLVYNMVEANVAGGALNDLLVVHGNLTLDGRIDIIDQGQTLGPGVYRIIDYDGALIDNGLTIGNFVIPPTTPQGSFTTEAPLTGFSVQTAIQGQVNLINTQGLTLTYWDGSLPANGGTGVPQDGRIEGGNGTWIGGSGTSLWTDSIGGVNAPWSTGGFAIFTGAPGTVDVDTTTDSIQVTGMQFATDGYTLQNGEIGLIGQAIVRVGDGTPASAGMTATIASVLSGGAILTKSDLGTLVLSGANTYTGGTAINGGAIQVASDANLGAAAGVLHFNGGTLRTTGTFTTARTTTLIGNGTFDTVGATALTMGSPIGGGGALIKAGSGTLVLSADNTYSGGTTITAGTLQVGNGGTSGSIVGNVANGGTLAFNRSDDSVYAGVISDYVSTDASGNPVTTPGNVVQAGAGTTILTGANTYTGGTTINAGELQIGNAGTSGSIVGDVSVAASAALAFNRTDSVTFGGVVTGGGALVQRGAGTTILTANSSYNGGTTIETGTLQLGDGGTTGSITGDVINNGVLAFNRSDVLTFGGVISGPGSLQQVGPGTTILTGANLMTGGSTVAAGTLQIGNGGTSGQLFGNIINNSTVILDRSDDLTYTSVISGTGNTIKEGAGTLIVTGANTYTGGTTINEGRIEVGNGGTTGSFVGNVVDNAELAVDRSDSFLITGVISGTGSFEQVGTGTTVFEANNTYAGDTTISAGTLQIGNGGTTGAVASANIVDNGTLVFNRSDDLELLNLVSGTGELVQAGLGTLIIENANTYSGGTAIQSGAIQISADTALGNSSGGLRMDGGTLRTMADMTTARATVLAQLGGTFETAGGTTLTHTGLIDGSGSLTKTGAGALLLTGANTYAGGTAVNEGILQLAATSTSSLNNLGTGPVDIAAGATLLAQTNGSFSFDNSLTGTGTLQASNSGGAFSFGPTAAVGTAFAGTVALSNDTFALSGDNTAALTNATLSLDANNVTTVGAGPQAIHGLTFNGGQMNFDATIPDMATATNVVSVDNLAFTSTGGSVKVATTAGYTPPPPDTVGHVNILSQDNSVVVTQLIAADTVTGSAASLTVKDQSDADLSNASGNVNILQGGNTVAIGSYGFDLTANDGTSDNGLYVSWGLTQLDLQAGQTLTLAEDTGASGADTTLSAKVIGVGNLAIDARAGTVILSNGTNSYTGDTTVVSGALQLGADNAMGQTDLLTVTNGAAADLNGFSQTVGAVVTQAGGTLNVGTGTLTVSDALRAPGVTSGGFLSTNSLFGAGTFVLDPSVLLVDGDQPGFTGTFDITGGSQLVLNSASALNNAAGLNVVGATDLLTFSRLDAFDPAASAAVPNGTAAMPIAGAGTVQVINGSDVTFAGNNNSFGGAFDIDAASKMRISQAANLGSAAVRNTGEFHVDTATDWQINNAVSGTGAFYKEGAGMLIAGPNLSYSGPTFVNAGTFAASAANTFSAASSVVVAAGATLDANGMNQTIAALTNAGTVKVASSNTGATPGAVLTVSGDYTGNNGTVALGTQWGDDSSLHDQLVIGGNVSGATALQVLHRGGGTGAQTSVGIDLVKIAGASPANAFSLSPSSDGFRAGSGGVIAAGPYDYTLKQGGNGGNANDWYLVSSANGSGDGGDGESGGGSGGGYRPEVGSYLDNRLMAMQSQWHTLHDRQSQAPGLLADGSGNPDANSWARMQGSFGSRNTGNFKTNDDSYLLHLGSDVARFNVGKEGSIRLGVMGMVSRSSGRTSAPGLGSSSQSVEGASAGVYATWYGRQDTLTGPYVDAWLLGGTYDNKVQGGGLPKEKYHSNAYSASLETGYGFQLHESSSATRNMRIILQPQAQVIVSKYLAGNHMEDNGTVVSNLNGNAVSTRLGVRLYANIEQGSGPSASRIRPFAELNWLHGPSSQTVAFDAIRVNDKLPANQAEFKLGVEGNLNRNLALWGWAGVRAGGGYTNGTVNVGMKYAW